jgi:hypothetical protein
LDLVRYTPGVRLGLASNARYAGFELTLIVLFPDRWLGATAGEGGDDSTMRKIVVATNIFLQHPKK